MIKVSSSGPGFIIELTSEQKEKLSGDVISILVRGENVFLFNQEEFKELIELRLSKIEDWKQRRRMRVFIHAQIIEISNSRAPRAQKRMLVTV
jgi:hypothetical protein